MNLRRPNSNEVNQTFNRSRSVVPMSGLCTRCIDGCTGGCEIFKAAYRGRELLYPGPFSKITAGADKNYPVDYSHLNIQGYGIGAEGLPQGVISSPDTARFPAVDTETEYGWDKKVRLKVPMFTGALGSTFIARNNWEHFATGAAISGVTIVCGENVCGIDPQLELDKNNKVIKSPEMDRRIETYKKYHQGYGEILVQMNVEDTNLGVAEYIINKHKLDTIELKWGQGAKCIGGEIKVKEIAYARELKKRGYIVTPDPDHHEIEAAYKDGAIKEFERHSRLGFISKEGFMAEVDRLRRLGYKRITLKTGAYAQRELAMALRFASEARIDLLTIDGAPGGTGMSPWPMMSEWGVPTFYLQSMAIRMADTLAQKGLRVPDLAIAGGFSSEDGIFKGLAMGAPYFKAVCMGRALMIPGMVGKNIGNWIKSGNLPKTVSEFGSKIEEIFVCYEDIVDKYGKKEADAMPLGAIGIYTFAQKTQVGLQQLMAGARKFNLSLLSRKDVMALSEEAAKISGIAYVMDAWKEEADKIINEG
ncbi:MAG: glutamate synthase [Spirochaetes bacterium GWF1_41_5]|nr:MAG: glutamate synthase [Spirochaetes bacterium GWF1_41_5]HBE03217.1 FMN-binding glutamate synthase family protein [Spirochaetia bacterium]